MEAGVLRMMIEVYHILKLSYTKLQTERMYTRQREDMPRPINTSQVHIPFCTQTIPMNSFKRERSIALQAVTALVSKSSTSITP